MSWAGTKPVLFEGEDEVALKLRFAELCAKDWNGRMTHGYTLFPGADNYGRAMACAEWLTDPFVVREINRLKTEDGGVGVLLLSPDEFAKKVLDEADDCIDKKVKLGYLELYAKTQGLIQKEDSGANVNLLVQNVIEVPSRITEDQRAVKEVEWIEQQRKLVTDARSSRPN
jgi:hypothetical protein